MSNINENAEEEFQKELMEKIRSPLSSEERIEAEFEKINKNKKQKSKLKREILNKEKNHHCKFIMLLSDEEVITFIFLREEEYMRSFYMEVCLGHHSSKFSKSDSRVVREFDKLSKDEKFRELIDITERNENIRFIEYEGEYINGETDTKYKIYGNFKKGNDIVRYELDIHNHQFKKKKDLDK